MLRDAFGCSGQVAFRRHVFAFGCQGSAGLWCRQCPCLASGAHSPRFVFKFSRHSVPSLSRKVAWGVPLPARAAGLAGLTECLAIALASAATPPGARVPMLPALRASPSAWRTTPWRRVHQVPMLLDHRVLGERFHRLTVTVLGERFQSDLGVPLLGHRVPYAFEVAWGCNCPSVARADPD